MFKLVGVCIQRLSLSARKAILLEGKVGICRDLMCSTCVSLCRFTEEPQASFMAARIRTIPQRMFARRLFRKRAAHAHRTLRSCVRARAPTHPHHVTPHVPELADPNHKQRKPVGDLHPRAHEQLQTIRPPLPQLQRPSITCM